MSQFDLDEIKNFLAYIQPANRPQLLAYVRELQIRYGAKWLHEFKKLHPDLALITDLIANHDAITAVARLEQHYLAEAAKLSWIKRTTAEAALPILINSYRPYLYQLHTDLRIELDKKQF